MNIFRALRGPAACGLIGLACQAPTADAHLNAALVTTCAPWDGAAVALFLTERPAVAAFPDPPYWGITVYKSMADVQGHQFDVSPESQNVGYGQVCPAVGDCYPARAASVRFGNLAPDSVVDVTYRMELTPGAVLRGTALARLYRMPGRCG